MANPNAPFGLAPVGTNSSSGPSWQSNRYWIPAADANAYFIGDIVKTTAAVGGDLYGVQQIVKITNGTDTPRGIIVGFDTTPQNIPSMQGTNVDLTQVSIPASKARDYYVIVCDDPNVIFHVRGDTTGTNQILANMGKNATLTVAAPTNAILPLSATVVNSSSIAVTSTFIIRLLGNAQIVNNAVGASMIWRGRFNQHELTVNQTAI